MIFHHAVEESAVKDREPPFSRPDKVRRFGLGRQMCHLRCGGDLGE
jgi:hypothetical protein